MITLPDLTLTHEQHIALSWTVANIVPARALLPHHPTSLALWQAVTVGLAAERLLWTANLRLVMRIAVDANQRGLGEIDELFQEGCIALQHAIRKYRPDLGYRLSTYAYDSIIRRLLHMTDPGPWVSNSRHFRRLRQLAKVGHEPERSSHLLYAKRVSLDDFDDLPHPDDPFRDVDSHGEEFLGLLSERSAKLLRLRFGFDGEPRSQASIAKQFGVSTSTVSRWEALAVKEARAVLSGDQTRALARSA